MKLYFAPLEGITTYTYRNTHAEMFGCVDTYFSPFINPSDQEKVSRKGMRDILPENNSTENLCVQVLTSNAESFLKFCEKIKPLDNLPTSSHLHRLHLDLTYFPSAPSVCCKSPLAICCFLSYPGTSEMMPDPDLKK